MEQMKSLEALMSFHDRDRLILIRTVPPYMIHLASMALQKKGEELRPDVIDALEKASIAPLSGLDELSIARVAKKMDEMATAMLRDLSPNNEKEAMLAVASWCVRMVDEGIQPDKTNQSVLVSLHLLDEAQVDPENWGYNEVRIKELAGTLLARGKLQGLYA